MPGPSRPFFDVDFTLAKPGPLLGPDGYRDAGRRVGLEPEAERYAQARAAVALALVALRGPLTFFLLPRFVLRPLARAVPLRAFLRFLLRPKVRFAVWATVLAGWHYPSAYDFVLSHQLAHDVQDVTFVLAGVLVWTQHVDPARRGELLIRGSQVRILPGAPPEPEARRQDPNVGVSWA
jgi:hypothetical protein